MIKLNVNGASHRLDVRRPMLWALRDHLQFPGTKFGCGASYCGSPALPVVKGNGSFKVERVVCAVGCGVAVTPDVVKAPMAGCIDFGPAAARYRAVTLKGGRAEQSSFGDYRILRMADLPRVEVRIAATGKRIRKLPIGGGIA